MYFVIFVMSIAPGLKLEDSQLSPACQKLLTRWRLGGALFLLLALQYLCWLPFTDWETR